MKITPTCKEVSELLSLAQDRPLTVREKVALYVHLPLCDGCRDFREQLAFISRAVLEHMRRD